MTLSMKLKFTLLFLALCAFANAVEPAKAETPKAPQAIAKPISEVSWFRYETMVRRAQDAQKATDDAKKEAENAYQQICKEAGAKPGETCQPVPPNPQSPDYAEFKFGKVTVMPEAPKVEAPKSEPAKAK
jgi:hypothetical protein